MPRTLFVALLLLGAGACSKVAESPPRPQTPEEVARVLRDLPQPTGVPVPTDAQGWPKGWPEHGVVFVDPEGNEGGYMPGPTPDPSKAERWRGLADLTPERLQMMDQVEARTPKEFLINEGP